MINDLKGLSVRTIRAMVAATVVGTLLISGPATPAGAAMQVHDRAQDVAADSTGAYVAGYTGGALSGQVASGASIIDGFVRKYGTGGSIVWTCQFGTGFPGTKANTVATSGGAVYVAGETYGKLETGKSDATSLDAFVRKYDTSGNLKWTRQFGTPNTANHDFAYGVAADATGVYIAGKTQGSVHSGVANKGYFDAFVRKYDLNGNLVWTRQYGTVKYDEAVGLSVYSGGVYVSGRTYGVLPGQVSQGNYDAYVRRYDQSGNLKWTRQLGSTQADYGNSVSVTASGVYVAGETWGTLAGQQSKGVDDAYLRKYNHSGTLQWTRQFGTGKYDAAYGVHADSSGIYVAGDTDGALSGSNTYPDLDAYVRKYNASGTHTWTKQYGSSKKDSALGVAASSGFVYAAGYTGNTVSGLDDATLRKYSSSGTFGWSTQFGGSK